MSSEECAICFDEMRVPYALACKHSFCYLCVKRSLENGLRNCPLCRSIIPQKILEDAKSALLDLDQVKGKWMYAGRTDGWWYYDPSTSDEIEENYTEYQHLGDESKKIIHIEILGRSYVIDFERMEQQSPLGKARRIQRVDESPEEILVKGVAGLRVVEEVEEGEPEYPDPESYDFNPVVWVDSEDGDSDEEDGYDSFYEDDSDFGPRARSFGVPDCD